MFLDTYIVKHFIKGNVLFLLNMMSISLTKGFCLPLRLISETLYQSNEKNIEMQQLHERKYVFFF